MRALFVAAIWARSCSRRPAVRIASSAGM
jgi:hypothetical protein